MEPHAKTWNVTSAPGSGAGPIRVRAKLGLALLSAINQRATENSQVSAMRFYEQGPGQEEAVGKTGRSATGTRRGRDIPEFD